MAVPITAIIITYNEEVNLPSVLKNVFNWAEQTFVVDSFSSDRTLEIAKSYGAEIHKHIFRTYKDQRNWALRNLPIKTEWVLFLDADEYISDCLREEIEGVFENVLDGVDGFGIKRKFYFLGKWIRYGDIYPSLVRLFKKGKTHYIETDGFREKAVVKGFVSKLKNPIIHDDKKGLTEWIAKQTHRAFIDAEERFMNIKGKKPNSILNNNNSVNITVEESKRIWLSLKILSRTPYKIRPLAQFLYRYIIRLGFLDGWQGFIYHFLLQLWRPLMVEAFYEELRYKKEFKR